jgi:hypothetical protein
MYARGASKMLVQYVQKLKICVIRLSGEEDGILWSKYSSMIRNTPQLGYKEFFKEEVEINQ